MRYPKGETTRSLHIVVAVTDIICMSYRISTVIVRLYTITIKTGIPYYTVVCFIFYYANLYSICFTSSAVIRINSMFMLWIFPGIVVKVATDKLTMY